MAENAAISSKIASLRVARPWGHWYKGRAAIQVDVDVRAIAG
jgi:hypothetical protein